MDETGVALGICSNSKVLAAANKKKPFNKSPENREWVTVVEVVSATGSLAPAVVIFKGVHLQSTWFPAKDIPN